MWRASKEKKMQSGAGRKKKTSGMGSSIRRHGVRGISEQMCGGAARDAAAYQSKRQHRNIGGGIAPAVKRSGSMAAIKANRKSEKA